MGCQDDACGRAGAGRLVRQDDRPMTLAQMAAYLQMSRAHLSNVINGRVAGVPPLRYVTIGRRNLVKQRLHLGARRTPMSFWSRRAITARSDGRRPYRVLVSIWCLSRLVTAEKNENA
jgi:AraC-like DNA-binding protein